MREDGQRQQETNREAIEASIHQVEEKVPAVPKVENVKGAQFWLGIVLKKKSPLRFSTGILIL